jgi:lipopolysaccharide biosynthesis protein
MELPPAWKIRRELLAAKEQLKAWCLQSLSTFLRPYYDKREHKSLRVHEGMRVLDRKIVVFLIHQPNGVAKSVFLSINYIVSSGHEVLLVSNGYLPKQDLEKLQSMCWKIIERENIGYDFGGYRCGINYLRDSCTSLDIVTLINDSIWFPIYPKTNLLAETHENIFDFGGAVLLPHPSVPSKDLILSYWVTFRNDLFCSKDFWDYWDQYFPTDSKILTVRMGERGLSRYMYKSGRRFDAIYSNNRFLDALRNASFQDLILTLKYASFTDDSFSKERTQLLEQAIDSTFWRDRCLNFIYRVSQRRNFLHSFCYAAVALLGVVFIKKNTSRLHVLMREQYLRAVRSGDLPLPDQEILQEIEYISKITSQ